MHFFKYSDIEYRENDVEGAKLMAKQGETDKDIDDLIFEGQEWVPSSR